MYRTIQTVYLALVALAVCVVTPPATAGYINYDGSIASSDFSFFPTPSAWDPGPNTARVGGFPAPGGATWSVMAAGVADSAHDDHAPGGPGADVTSDLSALYAGGVSEITTIGIALDKWAAVSGFTNLGMVADGGVGVPFGALETASGHVGDIRVGALFIDGASGSNTLAHAFQPGTETIFGPGGTVTGDMHFDTANSWSDGGAGGTIDFHTVALHEIGHALGLGHSTVVGSVMEAIYAGPRRNLGADDIAGIQAIYGAAAAIPEPSTFAMMALALVGMLGYGWRRKTRKPSA